MAEKSWFDTGLDRFDQLLNTAADAYEKVQEVVGGDNATASPQVHEQVQTGVQATGQPLASGGLVDQIKANWQIIGLVLLAVLVLIAVLKVVI